MKYKTKIFFKVVAITFLIFGFFIFFEVDINPSYTQKKGQNQEASQSISNSSFNVLPTGTPEVYGAELDLEYDDVSADDPQGADKAIEKMAKFDKNIQLENENLERYIHILYEKEGGISCEYCCGAPSIIFKNGELACGCAHSYAMRGIAKYLITEHGEEMSDERILGELGKWKVLFFPGAHRQKANALSAEGVEINYVNLTANTYRGIENGSQGGMVGGC